MLQMNPTNRNAGYCCTGSGASYIRPVCMSVPAAQASLLQGQQTYLPLRMFYYVALDQHTCLKPSSYVCNSYTRLAGMLQYPCFKRCFEPNRHVCCSCTRPPGTSVTIKLDKHACLLELHLPADILESVATELQAHL